MTISDQTSAHLAPIAFFCFNRADKTKEVLEALKQNFLANQSEIFIFCDGPRNIRDLSKLNEVYQVIDSVSGFKKITVTKRKLNHGIKASITDGINYVLENHDSVIVIEDDIVTAKEFLKFTNEALNFYKNDQRVWCVSGFNYPKNIVSFPKNYSDDVFFVRGRSSAWGWGTWKNRWQKIDFEIKDYEDFIKNKNQVKAFNSAGGNMAEMLRMQKNGKIDTWDIQMSYAMFKNNGCTIHPIKTLVKNIGFDASGTHTRSDLNLDSFEFENPNNVRLKKIDEIVNNNLAENSYIKLHRDPIFIIRWLRSKKRRRNLLWMLIGISIAEVTHFALKNPFIASFF